jgi:hypothetical protein
VKKVKSFLMVAMVAGVASSPCQSMEKATDWGDLPSDVIRSICTFAGLKRNTLALVSHKWHNKAIELTTYISSPRSNSAVVRDSVINGCPIIIPSNFPNLIGLGLTNDTPITKNVIDDMLNLNLKRLELTYCNQMSNDRLMSFTTLATLRLIANQQLTDQGVKFLVNLKRLKLCQQEKIKGDCFQNLTNLIRLHLQGTYAITTPSLSGLTSLIQLTLKGDYSRVDEDSELTDSVNLKKLGLHKHPTIPLEKLQVLPKLQILTLQGDLVISRQAMDLYEGKIGDKYFIKPKANKAC